MTTYYIVGFIIILHFVLGFGYIFYKINSGKPKEKSGQIKDNGNLHSCGN